MQAEKLIDGDNEWIMMNAIIVWMADFIHRGIYLLEVIDAYIKWKEVVESTHNCKFIRLNGNHEDFERFGAELEDLQSADHSDRLVADLKSDGIMARMNL